MKYPTSFLAYFRYFTPKLKIKRNSERRNKTFTSSCLRTYRTGMVMCHILEAKIIKKKFRSVLEHQAQTSMHTCRLLGIEWASFSSGRWGRFFTHVSFVALSKRGKEVMLGIVELRSVTLYSTRNTTRLQSFTDFITPSRGFSPAPCHQRPPPPSCWQQRLN